MNFSKKVFLSLSLSMLFACSVTSTSPTTSSSSKQNSATSASSTSLSASSSGLNSIVVITGWSSAAKAVHAYCPYDSTQKTLACSEKTYKTVKIGAQIWMAENLSYTDVAASYCYNSVAASCSKYGALYNWTTAQAVCPAGWHLPDTSEWSSLAAAVGGARVAGAMLKAQDSSWVRGTKANPNPNSFGFSALPSGYYSYSKGAYYDLGIQGYWWSASMANVNQSFSVSVGVDSTLSTLANPVASAFSVRCVKD